MINSVIEKFKNNPKFRYIVCGVASAVIILIVILCIVLSKEKNTEPDSEKNASISETEIINATPKPTEIAQNLDSSAENIEESSDIEEIAEEITETPTPTPEVREGYVRSKLDGNWVTEEVAAERPYCFMINNIRVAFPQCGVGEAKIIYEALAEGGITRFMAVFEGLEDSASCYDRIGSIRSARHYYASIATEYDAIFIHFGATKYANSKFEELNMVDQIEGMYIEGTIFYRDSSIKSPHNVFCSITELKKYFERKNFRTTHDDEHYNEDNHFNFNYEVLYPETGKAANNSDGSRADASSESQNATYITLSYDNWNAPHLEYDAQTGLYTRYQYDKLHADALTGEALTFTNIIIQIVHEWDKDKNDYQDMDLTDATGKGYYISQGQSVPITWAKREADGYMQYFGADGEVLTINPGKTLISIYPDFREDNLEIR